MNMASTECFNTLYEISHPQKRILVLGTSGTGKLTTVQRFIEQQTKKDYYEKYCSTCKRKPK